MKQRHIKLTAAWQRCLGDCPACATWQVLSFRLLDGLIFVQCPDCGEQQWTARRLD